MISKNEDELKRAVDNMHHCSAHLVQSVPIREKFERKVVWDGVIHLLHRKTSAEFKLGHYPRVVGVDLLQARFAYPSRAIILRSWPSCGFNLVESVETRTGHGNHFPTGLKSHWAAASP